MKQTGARRSVARPHNEEMQLTMPDGILVGGHGDHVRCRRAIVFESGLAADLRCWAGAGQTSGERRVRTIASGSLAMATVGLREGVHAVLRSEDVKRGTIVGR